MCKVSLTLIDGIPFVSLMKVLDDFAEQLMATNLRLHELNLKRIGHDKWRDANTEAARNYKDSKVNAYLTEDHHIAINKLVAVSRSLTISNCVMPFNLNMQSIRHSLQHINIQISPVTLISDEYSDASVKTPIYRVS